MKRFLCAGDIYVPFKKLFINKYLSVFSLFFMCFQAVFSTETVPAHGADRTVLYTDTLINSMNVTYLNGVVVDTAGNKLEGVNVFIRGTQTKTLTDKEGRFAIPVPIPEGIIVLTNLGYLKEEIRFNRTENKDFRVVLRPSVSDLDEVVVIGYGQTSRRFNTGSVSTISAKDIEKQPVTNVLAALSGRMPGVFVQTTNGLPGGNINIQIRGKGSIAAGTQPLYIIDGVPFDNSGFGSGLTISAQSIVGEISPISILNPKDIQSINVLKDADATSIYGSRGANGVIIIQTKKGLVVGKDNFSLGLLNGLNNAANIPKLLSIEDYLAIRREAFKNDGRIPSLSPGSTLYAPDILVWDTSKTTNWGKYLFDNTAKSSSIQLSLRAATGNTSFSTSLNYLNEDNILRGDNKYDKMGLKLYLNHIPDNKKWSFTYSAIFGIDKNNTTNMGTNATQNLFLPPHYQLLNTEGELNWERASNPLAQLNAINKTKTNFINHQVNLQYELLQNLKFKLSAGLNENNNEQYQIYPNSSLRPGQINKSSFFHQDNFNYLIEPQAIISSKISSALIELLLGSTYQHTSYVNQSLDLSDFLHDNLMYNIGSAGTVNAKSNFYSNYKYLSVFGRLNLNFLRNYIINLVVRRDGSSKFGPANRFGNFGSVGIAWLFGNEEWIKRYLQILDHGKIRISYGITGNDQIQNYQYLSSYSTSSWTYGGNATLQPVRTANDSFRWETNKKFDISFEIIAFKERLSLIINRYINNSNNQLVQYSLPGITGFNGYQANIPAVIRNSGWEFDTEIKLIDNINFKWVSSLNLSFPKNYLKKFKDIESSSYSRTLELGYDITRIYGYKLLEVNKENGKAIYADQNNNPTTTPYLYHTLGKQTPDYYGGLGNSLIIWNWNLDLFFQFVKQVGLGGLSYSPGLAFNNYSLINERWQYPGHVTRIPKASTTIDPYFASSSANFFDSSYLRLKNISLTYNLHVNRLKWLKLNNLQISLNVQNAFTVWDNNSAFLDPESGSIKGLVKNIPPVKSYVIGLSTTF